MKYVIEVRKNQYCDGCSEDIFTCIRCDYSLLSMKPISSIDMNDLNSLASKEADKCRTKQQDADYHNDCCECYIAGYKKAILLITE